MRSDFGADHRTAEIGRKQTSLPLHDMDAIRLKVNGDLKLDRKSDLGQFMTPSVIADFMASLFDTSHSPASLMDAGAGIGSLTIAAVRRLGNVESVDAWEIDPLMLEHLEANLARLAVKHRVSCSGLHRIGCSADRSLHGDTVHPRDPESPVQKTQ